MNRKRSAIYRKAFNEIIEYYETVSEKSVSAINISDTNGGTVNLAQPTNLDFVCDVDNIIAEVVEKKDLQSFWNTYIIQDSTKPQLNKSQQNSYSYRIGQLLCARAIWPISKYFFVIRKKIGE